MNSFFTKPYVQLLCSFILVAVLVALAAYTYATLKQAEGFYTGETTISVTGEGEVFAVPDVGQFSFAVETEGDDATTAQSDATDIMDTIMAYLTSKGVSEADIKTTAYNVMPKYRYESRPCPLGSYCPPGEQIEDGFQVYQSVTVKVRVLDDAGTLIAGLGEAGAKNISNVQFTIDDESVLQAEARKAAIAEAKQKAQELATDLGMRLSRIVGFQENDENFYPMMERSMAVSDSVGLGGGLEKVTVPTGENTISSSVTITYELQ